MTATLRLPPLLALRAFEAAARQLSFTEAANELHLTQGAISRQIRMLETYLGAKLFDRFTRRIELTEVGRDYFRSVQTALGDIQTATKAAMGDAHRLITLNVLPTLSSMWLMPKLASFTEAYSNIEVHLVSSIEPVDFRANDVDVAIRVGRLPGRSYDRCSPRIELEMVDSWKDVEAQYLYPDILVPVISRKLLSQGHPIDNPGDILHYRLIHTATRKYAWNDWLENYGLAVPARMDALGFGHFFMAIRAAKDCKGVALIPQIILDNMPPDPELVCPIGCQTESAGAYYLLTRNSAEGDPAVRLIKKWIMSEAAQFRGSETPGKMQNSRQ